MMYIVGWSDLPAARTLVPAMKVLDYVSPWVLEQWEYDFELELEEERAQLVKDKKEQARAVVQEAVPGNNGKKKGRKGKKRGRPPTHKHTQIEAGAVALPETEEEASRARMKPGAMSLSTPQKTRLADFEDLSEEEGSPSRRTQAGLVQSVPDSEEDTMDVDVQDRDAVLEDFAQGMRPFAAANTLQGPGFQFSKVTPVPLPPLPRAATSLQQRTLPKMFSTVSAGSGLSSESSSKSTTPVPLPVLPALRPSQSMPTAPAAPPSSPFAWASYQNNKRPASSSVVQPPVTAVLPPIVPPSAGSTPSVTSRPTSSKSRSKTPKPSKPSKRPPKKKRNRTDKPLLDEDGQPVWIVKRIEDEAMFEIEGGSPKKLYKVRWEGDWPPDENPTWEPVENLPREMIRNWQKTGSKAKSRLSKGLSRKIGVRRSSTSGTNHKNSNKKSTKAKQSRLDWGGAQKVTSVRDVFATETDELQQHQQYGDDIDMGHSMEQMDEGFVGDDEVFLVETGLEQTNKSHRSPLEAATGERPSFASRMSSWGAFFGGK
jgi:hypothetical protein